MFGVGFTEILMIAIVAVIFLGPDKLPSTMVEIAKFIKKAKSAVTDAKESLNSELDIEGLKKELGLDDIKNEALAYKQELLEAREKLAQLNPIDQFKEQKERAKAEMAEMENSFHEDIHKLSQTNQTQEIQNQNLTSSDAQENLNQTIQDSEIDAQEVQETTTKPSETSHTVSKPSATPSPYKTPYDTPSYQVTKERNDNNA